MDALLSVASMLDPQFKNRYNDDDQMMLSTISSELMAMVTQEESDCPSPSTAAAQGTTAEGEPDDGDTCEPVISSAVISKEQ